MKYLLFLLSVAGLTMAAQAQAHAAPTIHEVRIENMVFTPAELSVHVGDTIVWKNLDLVPHNVFSAQGKLASGTLKPGAKWRWTAKGNGPLPYMCSLHPTMTAKLQVHPKGGR